jgi:CelD/BcsL family acetyltransferase involved in cellulose biosynthesis
MTGQGPFQVKVLKSLKEVEQIRESWSALQWNPESDIDFYSFIVNVRPEVVRPLVISVSQGGETLSLLAGRVEDGHLEIKVGYKVIWRANVRRIVVFYGGFLGAATGEICEIVVRMLMRSLREERADLLVWGGIQQDSKLGTILKRVPSVFCRDYLTLSDRHWRMTLPESLEELLEQRMNKKHRYWARKTLRTLEKDFPDAVRFTCYSGVDEVETLFRDAIQVARKTYQWGLQVGFRDGEEQRGRLRLAARLGWLRGYVLYLKAEPVAFWICLVYKNMAHSAYTGYDPQYRRYEIGTALFLQMIDALGRENVRQLDFGLGSALYKERFGDSSFEEATVCVFAPTIRGVFLNGLRLLTEGPLELVRGVLRRLGLEQKIKRAWRSHKTPAQAAKEPPQAQA